MNGSELYRLARRLSKVAVRSIPPSEFRDLPTAVRMVMVDVFENPDSTIGQIVERTGFPQSHVSASVARLRDSGMIVTTIDSEDRRRTLVGPSRAHLAKARESRDRKEPIDEVLRSVLTEEFGISGPDHLEELLHALDVLQRLLAPPLTRRPTSCAEGTPCSSD